MLDVTNWTAEQEPSPYCWWSSACVCVCAHPFNVEYFMWDSTLSALAFFRSCLFFLSSHHLTLLFLRLPLVCFSSTLPSQSLTTTSSFLLYLYPSLLSSLLLSLHHCLFFFFISNQPPPILPACRHLFTPSSHSCAKALLFPTLPSLIYILISIPSSFSLI